MSIAKFIVELEASQIRIRVEHGELKISAPKHKITAALISKIKHHKVELVEYFSKAAAPRNYFSIPVAPQQEYYATSHSQRRLWLLDQMEPGNIAYNISGAYKINGDIDYNKLNAAFQKIVERHEILRTVFVLQDGEPKQKIISFDNFNIQLEYLDVRRNPSKDAAVSKLGEEMTQTSFDLANDALIRVKLVQCDTSEFVFLFTLHHIISDGWSMEVFLNEMLSLYEGYKKGVDIELHPLAIQYKDYAAWQNTLLREEQAQSSRQYWHEEFEREIPVLALIEDRQRPSQKTYRGKCLKQYFSANHLSKVKQFCTKHEVSVFMLMLGGVVMLLHKYTGQGDIILGTPVAGRDHTELEDQIGFYVNTLALRTSINADDTVLDLLNRVKNKCLNAFSHQNYPFDKLLEELRIRRDPARSPLFDVMVSHGFSQDESISKPQSINVNSVSLNTVISKFDLSFYFEESRDGIRMNLEFNSDLFDSLRMERLLIHFRNLMDVVLSNPQLQIKSIAYLSGEEQDELVGNADRSKGILPFHNTIQEEFEQKVSEQSESLALSYKEDSYSYQSLNAYANQIAHHLREAYQVKPGEMVGLQLKRGFEMVAGIIGIIKSGAAYVPLDPDFPQERLEFIKSDAGIRIVLDSTEISKVELSSKENPVVLNTPDDIAYVIYTSGSTGHPKGVKVSHRNVLSLIKSKGLPFNFDSADVWSLYHSISFDFSVWEIWGCFLFGGRLVVISKEVARDPEAFSELMISEKVTVLNQVPPVFENVMKALLRRDLKKLNLKYVIFGGSALNPKLLKTFRTKYPDVKLVNMYGITETTVHVTFKEITNVEIEAGECNIGIPLGSHKVFLVDDDLNLKPKGTLGELLVGGAGVSLGYLNKRELTQEKFIPSPFHPGEILYCSGDLGFRKENGEIIYMGRKDDQVKVRGFRIEPGEVEKTLIKNPAIDNATVIADQNNWGENHLIAFVKVKTQVTEQQLRYFLLELLPEHLIPAKIICLEEIPLTSNGKVDKMKLLELAKLEKGREANVVESPRTLVQEHLCNLWAEILSRQKVGINENFFELGGDSLKAVKVFYRVDTLYPGVIKVPHIFSYPTIAALAHYIEQRRGKLEATEKELTELEF